jgi:hypothetical protein
LVSGEPEAQPTDIEQAPTSEVRGPAAAGTNERASLVMRSILIAIALSLLFLLMLWLAGWL